MARHFESETGHAWHLARPREQSHPADVEVAQDLRPDAVVAQVHLDVGPRLVGHGARSKLQRGFRAVQQNQDATLGLRQGRERRGYRPRVRAASMIDSAVTGCFFCIER